jgi:malate permease and related proteins
LDNLIFSFNAIIPVFLVMGVGYFIKEIGLIDDRFIATAVKMNFKIGLSTLIFYNIYKFKLSKVFNIKLVVFVFLCILIWAIVLSFVVPIFIKDKKRASAMVHTIFRSNFVLLGIPFGINMLGKNNIGAISLLIPIAIPLYNFLAVVILSAFDEKGGQDIKVKIKYTIIGIIKNPLIIASAIGIIMQLFLIKLPLFLDRAVSEVAALGTPLAIITLGAQLEFKSLVNNLKYSLIATFGRLVMVPGVVVSLAILMGFRGSELGAIFVLFSAPSAVSSYVMAREMNSDYKLTGDVVILTTFFSMFTIFIGVYLLKTFSLI